MNRAAIPDGVAHALFHDAHTAVEFGDEPIPVETIRRIHDLARMCPTAGNLQPMRMVVARSTDARARIAAAMTPHNRARTESASVNLILAADNDFHLQMAVTSPSSPQLGDTWARRRDRPEVARFNAAIQIGHLLVAVRAVGLAATPMQGFDADLVRREFFADRSVTPLLVLNLGVPERIRRPHRPRLDFDAVAQIV